MLPLSQIKCLFQLKSYCLPICLWNLCSILQQVSIYKHTCYLYWCQYGLPNEYVTGCYKNKYSHMTMNLQAQSVLGDRIYQYMSYRELYAKKQRSHWNVKVSWDQLSAYVCSATLPQQVEGCFPYLQRPAPSLLPGLSGIARPVTQTCSKLYEQKWVLTFKFFCSA